MRKSSETAYERTPEDLCWNSRERDGAAVDVEGARVSGAFDDRHL